MVLYDMHIGVRTLTLLDGSCGPLGQEHGVQE